MPESVIREESFSPAEHLQDLLNMNGECVSIFLPINGAQVGGTLFPTYIKAALNRAKQTLNEEFGNSAASKWPPAELAKFARKIRTGPQQGGLAIFSCNEKTHIFHAPKTWNEFIHVGNECYIRPLLSLLMQSPAFYLLTLNEQNRRLLLCTPEGAEDIALPDSVPGNLNEATLFKQPDHRLEHGSASSSMPGDNRGIRFSTNADEEKHDIYLRQFFSKLDAALRPLLTIQQYPLMLAGVRRELALYIEVNTYEHLLKQHVETSPRWLSPVDLSRLANEAWQDYVRENEAGILKELNDADSHAKLVKDSLQLLSAVESGKIHHLALPELETGRATDDMINHLAIAALRQGSRVSVLKHEQIPGGCATGILRYGREEQGKQAKAS